MGPDALETAENEYGSTKHENGTQRHRYCRKQVRARKHMKMGLDVLGIAENEYGKTGPVAP
jgi:hypothetical protein